MPWRSQIISLQIKVRAEKRTARTLSHAVPLVIKSKEKQDRQHAYKRNNEARSTNQCCLIYPACKSHAPCYLVICVLSGSTTFSDFISKKGMIFVKRKFFIQHKMSVLIFSTTSGRNISHFVYTSPRYHRYSCKAPLFLSDINKTLILSSDFRRYSNIKFHVNPPNGGPVFPRGQADVTKPAVAFRNFANAPDER
jgi:hypothetical protein